MARWQSITYRMTARVIKSVLSEHPDDREALRLVASRLSAEFKDDNPRHSATTFMSACGFEDQA